MPHPTILVTRDASARRHARPRIHLLLAAAVATLAAQHARAQAPVDSASRADTTVRVAMQPAAPIPASQADGGRGDQPAARLPAPRHLDFSVALRAGTLGAGVEVGKLVTSHLAVRAGYSRTPIGMTRTVSDVNYDARAQLQGVTLLADLFPSARGRFHVTAGAVVHGPRVTASALPGADGTITLNGRPYTQAEFGRLTGTLSTPSVAPYLGLGLGTPARKSAVSLVTDFGVMLGAPTLALDATGAATNPTLRSDLAAQQAKTQQQISRYGRVIPVSSIGLAVRF